MSTVSRTTLSHSSVARLIVRCPENEGVEYVFGIPGEENIHEVDARFASCIRFILVRDERGASFLADTYGRLTGRAGVCLAALGARRSLTSSSLMHLPPTGQPRPPRIRCPANGSRRPALRSVSVCPRASTPWARRAAGRHLTLGSSGQRLDPFGVQECPGAPNPLLPVDSSGNRTGSRHGRHMAAN